MRVECHTIFCLCFSVSSGLVVLTVNAYKQVSQLFDNEGTVAFAMFMAIWGEFWPFS